MRTPFALGLGALLALSGGDARAQMMGGNASGRGAREAMSERLANASPDQRAYLEALRDERAGDRRVMQRTTMGSGIRSYTLGSDAVSEWTGHVTYSMRTPRLRLRASGALLRFDDGDTLSISGLAPFDASIDVGISARDSVRLSLRTPSRPSSLSGPQVAALASVGTSTVDLSSIEFGTPANVSAWFTHLQPLGASTTLSASFGGDYEPRPRTEEWTYWRGSTAGVRVRLAGSKRLTRISGDLELTRSFRDSLDGRNLFQGGGTLLARAEIASLIGRSDDVLIDLSAYYFRPFSTVRGAAANRRVPVGDLLGASAMGVWPIRNVFVTPIVLLARESSRTTSAGAEIEGSGWSLGTALAMDLPVGRAFALTPELGYTRGSIRTDLIFPTTPGPGRLVSTDPLTGWWARAELSVAF